MDGWPINPLAHKRGTSAGREFRLIPTPRIALSVTFLHHLTRTISRQQKELLEIRWCQIARILEGFLDFGNDENRQNAKNDQKGKELPKMNKKGKKRPKMPKIKKCQG